PDREQGRPQVVEGPPDEGGLVAIHHHRQVRTMPKGRRLDNGFPSVAATPALRCVHKGHGQRAAPEAIGPTLADWCDLSPCWLVHPPVVRSRVAPWQASRGTSLVGRRRL